MDPRLNPNGRTTSRFAGAGSTIYRGGIKSSQADYTTIDNNVVYNTAWYVGYVGSGISIPAPFNSDPVLP